MAALITRISPHLLLTHSDGRLAEVPTGGMSVAYGAYCRGLAGTTWWTLGGAKPASLATTRTADGAVDTISGNGYLLDLYRRLGTRPGSPLIVPIEGNSRLEA